jgi:acetylornithine deacetylase/succinyl-diaminopimelate desuccinylase-like protein
MLQRQPVGPRHIAHVGPIALAAEIADGYVWGRGTLDDKASVIAILEAVEWLVGQGFEPRRIVCLACRRRRLGGTPGAALAILGTRRSFF